MNKEQGFLVLVLAIAAVASLFIVIPFLEFVLLAIIIAYVLHPFNTRFQRVIGRRAAPMITIAGATIVAIAPVIYVTLVLYRDLQRFAAGGIDLELSSVEAWIADVLEADVDLAGLAERFGTAVLEILFGDVTHFISIGAFYAIGLALVLFLVYYLLRDGQAFVDWLIRVVPASDAVCHRLLDQLDDTTRGVIVGHLFVALAQGLVGGVGLWIAGIPNVVFWTFVMIVLCLLPLIGAFLVWAPAAGYLFLLGQSEWGLFLVIWGLIPVSLIDNYARPIVIDRDAHLNPGIILIGVFGGIYALGFIGLFVGPIVLGALAATLTVFHEEYDRLADASSPPG